MFLKTTKKGKSKINSVFLYYKYDGLGLKLFISKYFNALNGVHCLVATQKLHASLDNAVKIFKCCHTAAITRVTFKGLKR